MRAPTEPQAKPMADPSAIPPLRDLQYRLEYLGLRILIGFVRLLPIDVAGSISATLWRLLAPYNRRHTLALAHLERAFPDKTLEEREKIALRMWGNLGRVMVETMNIDRILKEPDRLHVTNAHVIGRYKDKMGPVLIVTMHMGNWELGMWPIMLAGVKPAGVYRLVKNPYVDRYLRAQRKDLYPGGLFGSRRAAGQDEGQKTARLIMDYVRQGGRLGFISDLYDAQGVDVPFFGYPAKSMPIAAMIARRVGARIWIGRCIRIGNRACFDINVNELRIPRTNNQAEDIRSITAAIQRQFEGWIRENPDQFMWSNRRWS
jgi:Kdo2-lipid IVA lauroyltransferase/acyltransferase